MKFLIVSAVFPPNVVGGAEISAYTLALALRRAGHEIAVLTMAERDERELWGESNDDGLLIYRLRFPRKETTFGAHSRPMSKFDWKIWHMQDFLDWRLLRKIGRILDQYTPDYVAIHLLDGIGFNILPLFKKRSVSVSFFLHDLSFVCSNSSMFKNGEICKGQCVKCRIVSEIKNMYLSILDEFVLFSPSRANLEKVKRYLPVARKNRGFVLRNIGDPVPGDIDAWKPSEDGTIRLMFAGRLHPTKGIDLLLEALAPLKDKYRFRLSVYGRGEMEAELRQRFGREEWVHFAGFVAAEEVVRAIVKHDLVCTPSIWAEIYGRVTAQALMMGIPVIGSDIGGTSELIRDGITGRLVPPGEVDSWTAVFEEIFSRPNSLREYSYNAKEYAYEFNENDVVETFIRGVKNDSLQRARS